MMPLLETDVFNTVNKFVVEHVSKLGSWCCGSLGLIFIIAAAIVFLLYIKKKKKRDHDRVR